MGHFSFVTHDLIPAHETISRITDLAIVTAPGGADVLISTTRYDGLLDAWNIGGSGIGRIDGVWYGRPDTAGSDPHMAFIETDSGVSLLSGGGHGGALTLRPLRANGGLDPAQSLGTIAALPGDLTAAITVALPAGGQMVYGGVQGAGGVAGLRFDAHGGFLGATLTADSPAVYADRVSAVTSAEIDGSGYLFSAGAGDVGVTAWRIGASGDLAAVDNADFDDGLWISAPTALTTGSAFGKTYVVVAAAGSGSLSAIEVAADGEMRVTDHVLDALDTRFAGVTALETVSYGGQSWILAGGADDGISLFRIMPGGRLLHCATIADSAEMGLDNVSAIAARAAGDGLDIFVSSASEPGLTRLRYDTGPQGQVVSAVGAGDASGGGGDDMVLGNAADNQLFGGNGDDILMDGGGADRMQGGGGDDIFVMTADGEHDVIADFSLGHDRIDLSNWDGLRNIGQLELTQTATGFRVEYRDEVLDVEAGGPLNPALLQAPDSDQPDAGLDR